MQVKSLGSTPFDVIVDCFFVSFDNYFVKFPNDKALFKNRWEMAKVNYDLSFGMFDNDTLVGFILHGIDYREHDLIAFNLATGVIPQYRGKKITQQIYEVALPKLKQFGVTKCKLEVIQENTFAIRAYKSIGYTVVRGFNCFSGEINITNEPPYELKEVNIHDYKINPVVNQSLYSYENQIGTLSRGPFKCFQIVHHHQMESVFIINVENGYIAQLDVLLEQQGTWERLFSALKNISSTVKINNVDDQLTAKIEKVKAFGLINTINQFEMELIMI
ncbi:GNAT family N-acetyltransferase [Geojedonia litorea]|uniref:GNAT family N-acetyltransferase n=1 Tax=Geojedonia litorea TaxID=1268269 RepID=A0ABV9N1P5_9FLAO